MTILSKILDWAKVFGEIEIFIHDMSTVVKNDNIEQNPGLDLIFEKILIFILYMSAMVKNDNFEQNPGLGQNF